MNVKIEQELNFIVDSRLFLDAQEAKKVSEHTYSSSMNLAVARYTAKNLDPFRYRTRYRY